MTVINTNTSSMIARDAINRNDRAMSQAMERLSTGSRINSAKDDAADRKALARALPRKAVASPERSRFVEDELLSEFRTLGLARTPGWYRIISSIDPIAQYQVERVTEAEPVSYTHLTLPTICSV